ncbi:MAG: tRNA (adenosine(37)-N6)-threonylcarbamoyltransferase complex dimerization subunit type 1 TsaB [Oscillospiraceae bacterium]|nr:tRNA (adenosine(37)-N6)-threonylcarbamoyltransferase complex dimerization subunit type 1 TsaB [Oscillospiraceae bacterium]
MILLALESSATAASVAVCRGEELIAQSFQHTGLTHSETLMPMVEDLLKNAGLERGELGAVAAACGPGSFTGLRIGMAAAKGLAWSLNIPCIGVSTLEAMAWQLSGMEGVVCAAMDARRQQVYRALFRLSRGRPERLCPDGAVSLEQLEGELAGQDEPKIFVGDGAHLCYNSLKDCGGRLAPPHLLYQSAWGVARCALELEGTSAWTDAAGAALQYHRLPQAERERLARQQAEAEPV